MLFVTYGCIVFSCVFAITDRRDMGMYDVPMLMSLFGLGKVMIFASFQTCGMMFVFSANGPKCYKCFMLMLSGPIELLVCGTAYLCVCQCVVLMNCLLNEFAMCVGVMAVMSLNVMELLMDFNGGFCCTTLQLFSTVCECYVCDPSG